MKIAFDAEFGRIWTDNLTPCVFTLIFKFPASAAQAEMFFSTQVDLAKTLFKRHKEAYLISDFSPATEEARKQLCDYYMEYLPQLVKAKVTYMAFVCPATQMDQLPTDKKEKIAKWPISIFPNFTEALAAVNLKRSVHLSQKFVSIL